MNKRRLNILVSLIVAGLFVWLAVRSIDLADVGAELRRVSLWWLPLFIVVLLASHHLRAMRWRLLLPVSHRDSVPGATLFAGVMTGYFVNNLVPRLGEISRPVYVAKRCGMDTGNLIGTIVLERIIDVFSMFCIVLIVAVYLSREFVLLEELLGIDEWPFLVYVLIPVLILLFFLSAWALFRALQYLEKSGRIQQPLLKKLIASAASFGEGMVSIRHIPNWPKFVGLTIGIWIGYILMTYIPFFMLDLHDTFGLGLADAMVLTIVSSIGVTIPTPAGIGSYHLLIQQSMWLIYGIPLATALTFATVAHASTVLIIVAATPIIWWWDKNHTRANPVER
ncbi:MAG: lysylphosphatidylglycerol synthase transmembrane domain-containing protein [Balneolaceae bacterium]